MDLINLFELFAILIIVAFLARLSIYVGGLKGMKKALPFGDDER